MVRVKHQLESHRNPLFLGNYGVKFNSTQKINVFLSNFKTEQEQIVPEPQYFVQVNSLY